MAGDSVLIGDFINIIFVSKCARADMVCGYSASYAGSYISASSPVFAVGEFWDSSTSKVLP